MSKYEVDDVVKYKGTTWIVMSLRRTDNPYDDRIIYKISEFPTGALVLKVAEEELEEV